MVYYVVALQPSDLGISKAFVKYLHMQYFYCKKQNPIGSHIQSGLIILEANLFTLSSLIYNKEDDKCDESDNAED